MFQYALSIQSMFLQRVKRLQVFFHIIIHNIISVIIIEVIYSLETGCLFGSVATEACTDENDILYNVIHIYVYIYTYICV